MIKQYGLYNLKEVTEEESKKNSNRCFRYIKEICEKKWIKILPCVWNSFGAVRHRGSYRGMMI